MVKKEYNLLTKKLLADGYTAEAFPEYVHIDTSRFGGGDPLNNLSGGFVFNPNYRDKFIYKTGCGMYVKSRSVSTGMSYMGVDWSHENNCPVIRCPYDISECEYNDKRLHGIHGGGLCIQCFCVCHRTNELYDYDNSFEKQEKERREERDRKYQEYSDAHNGRVCQKHMYFDERTRSWNLNYNPSNCRGYCPRNYSYCPILGRELSKKRGNVYYDLKETRIRHDGTLFDGERWTNITRSIRYFDRPISMDICEAFVKLQSGEIYDRLKCNEYNWRKIFDKTLEFEVLNVRAESKPSRDLMQDLEDIRNGIRVFYNPDNEKLEKEDKKARREVAKQKRIEKLEKKILEVGYENLEEYSLDKVHADKWLSDERIAELEEMRKQAIRKEKDKPVQMSLFDMEGFN